MIPHSTVCSLSQFIGFNALIINYSAETLNMANSDETPKKISSSFANSFKVFPRLYDKLIDRICLLPLFFVRIHENQIQEPNIEVSFKQTSYRS